MANLFAGVEPPQWLSDQLKSNAQFGREAGAVAARVAGAGTAIARGARPGDALAVSDMNAADPLWQTKLQLMRLKGAQMASDVHSQNVMADIKLQQLREEAFDRNALAGIVKTANGNAQILLKGLSEFVPQSSMGHQASSEMRIATANRVATDDFTKRASVLPPEDYSQIMQMSRDPNSGLPTKDAWSALSMAEERMRVKHENERQRIANEQAALGIKPTVTITDKETGVTQTFKPETGSESQFQPTTITDSKGTTFAHVSPQRWQVIKGEKVAEYTPEVMRDIAKQRLEGDPGDAVGKQILDALSARAVEQLKPRATSPSTESIKGKQVIRYTPDGKGAIFDADTKQFLRYAD